MAQTDRNTEELLPTRHSLLSRIRNRDDSRGWADFFQTYRSLVYQVARQSGLSHYESEEVVQETVITVSKRIPQFHYDPSVCSFKTWLMNLTRWRIVDQLRKRPPAGRFLDPVDPGPRTTLLDRVPDPRSLNLDQVWETEWRNHLLAEANQAVRLKVSPEQYQIFDLYVVKQWPVSRIASELGISAASVYLAKHRVASLLRREVKRIEKSRSNADVLL